MVSGQQILNKFPALVNYVGGNLELQAQKPCSCETPQKNNLCFIPKQKWLTPCLKSGVTIAIIAPEIEPPPTPLSCCFLSTSALSLSMSLLLREFFGAPLLPPQMDGHRIHPSATISQKAQLGKNAIIGPQAVISEGVSVGDNSYIGAHSYIGPRSTIGHNSLIEPNVTIQQDVIIGHHCRIQPQCTIGSDGCGYGQDSEGHYHFKPHYGKVILEDFVELGAGVQVDRGAFNDTSIGEGTKLDNHCHIAHNVVIGKHCILLAGALIGGSTKIGNHCVIGGRTTISGHLNICDRTLFGGLSGITRDIKEPGSYGGYPIMPLKQALKSYALVTQLPELKKKLNQLFKNLN